MQLDRRAHPRPPPATPCGSRPSTAAQRTLIADDVESLSRLAATALVMAEARSVDGFLLMLRSVANPRATEILRAAIDAHFQRPLQALLPGAQLLVDP